ncbi:MAG: reverse transcriptase/maturase family protein [Clostridiales bacterium]|nr:reverse transcriptase/maturase family protein [Clostridiales bacterium]
MFRVKVRKEGAKALQTPIEVLHILANLAQNESYVFRRIYRNLYNPEFYWYAFQNIYADTGRIGDAYGGTSIGVLTDQRVADIITTLKDGSYQPVSPDGSRDKVGNDRLVQEIIRLMLESIYEPVFKESSHGFRPNLSAQTALFSVEKLFTGSTWLGNIRIEYDGIASDVVWNLLKKRIDDEALLRLIRKFLKSGYGSTWIEGRTYSGVPLGVGLGPILLNITLHELDQFMENYAAQFNTGVKRKVNPDYDKAAKRASYYRRMGKAKWDQLAQAEKKERTKKLRSLESAERELPSKLPMDTSYKRIQYVRYAGEILIGVCGSKADMERTCELIQSFLEQTLCLHTNKPVITHGSDRIRYLGYDISISRQINCKTQSDGAVTRAYSGGVRLLIPRDVWVKLLFQYHAVEVRVTENGKEKYAATHRGELINHSDAFILARYRSEIQSLYYYYAMAVNSFRIGIFANLMKHSMYKTFAGKYKTNVNEIKRRYCKNGVFTLTQGDKSTTFYNSGFPRRIMPFEHDNISDLSEYTMYSKRDTLKDRIARYICEVCKQPSQEIEIFQVEHISDLKRNTPWANIMRRKHQRSLVVCPACMRQIKK